MIGLLTCSDGPWQQFFDAIDRVIGDVLDDVAQVGFRIHTVELGRSDQAVDRGSTSTAGIGTTEQVVLSSEGYGAQCSLGGIVVDLDASVVAIPSQRRPAREHIADRLGELGLLR